MMLAETLASENCKIVHLDAYFASIYIGVELYEL